MKLTDKKMKTILTKLVHAMRLSEKTADGLAGIFENAGPVETISGDISDIMMEMIGNDSENDYDKQFFVKLVRSKLSDEFCAEYMMRLPTENKAPSRPYFFSPDELNRMKTGYAAGGHGR